MSHVAIGQNVCPVCGVLFETGEVLIHKRLRPIKEKDRVTGASMCPEHKKLHDEGYVALVELDRAPRSGEHPLFNVPRTGQIAHVRAHVWASMTDQAAPQGIAVVEKGVIQKLKEAMPDEAPRTEPEGAAASSGQAPNGPV